jgi:hypothetical protein
MKMLISALVSEMPEIESSEQSNPILITLLTLNDNKRRIA